MKKFVFAVLVIAIAFSAFAGDVVKRGAAISPDAKALTIAQVMEKPDDYRKKPVVVEGTVASVCSNMGCWMQLDTVRVTFKDYGFFVPTDSKGMQARAEGVVKVKTLSKEEADHLEGEGAKLNRNADGTAKEVTFVANGVELKK
jgi:Na+-transporting methylmalonyl-CoA/oxaloacetate decarboxylase gamma subunit